MIENQNKENQPFNLKSTYNLHKQRTSWGCSNTQEKLHDVDKVKFVYADMYGNLKIVPNPSPLHHKSVFDF